MTSVKCCCCFLLSISISGYPDLVTDWLWILCLFIYGFSLGRLFTYSWDTNLSMYLAIARTIYLNRIRLKISGERKQNEGKRQKQIVEYILGGSKVLPCIRFSWWEIAWFVFTFEWSQKWTGEKRKLISQNSELLSVYSCAREELRIKSLNLKYI